jgi:hypothetical protein
MPEGNGTPRELLPVTEQVLAWVAAARARRADGRCPHATADDIRRIELCALATREAAFFHDLYGPEPLSRGHFCHGDCHHGDDDAPAPEVQDER